jgi:hypothetical protein
VDIGRVNLLPEDIGMARMFIRVTKTWMDQSGIDPQNIRLFRLDNGVWTELTTNYVGLVGENYEYESISPGFSYFAIGSVIAPPPVITPPTQNVTVPPSNPTPEKPAATPQVTPETKEQTVKSFWIEAVVGLFVIAAIILILSMKFSSSSRRLKQAEAVTVGLEDIKKSYAFEGNQIIKEYHDELAKISRNDAQYTQKVNALREESKKKIADLQAKYKEKIIATQAKK